MENGVSNRVPERRYRESSWVSMLWIPSLPSQSIEAAARRRSCQYALLGMTWTYLHTYRSVDDELNAFQAVSRKRIRQVLDRYPLEQTTHREGARDLPSISL